MKECLAFVALGALLCAAKARGPLCLDCNSVEHPHHCTDVKECWPWESCYGEHFVFVNGSQAFTFGCRATQQCVERAAGQENGFELKLCEACCTGELCNNNICTNGTAPPPGTPCLECSGAPSTTSCTQLAYCPQGQICYTERSTSSATPVYNMGCLRKEVCTFFGEEIIGRRSVRFNPGSGAPCHECCSEPVCNHGACEAYQPSTTESPQTTSGGPTTELPAPRDCWDLRHLHNVTADGIYQVRLPSGKWMSMRCDMKTDGGGWIVFQKRFKGDVNFDQTYERYRTGFGTLADEFWMGNDLLRELTQDSKQKLRVDLCDWSDYAHYAVYEFFSVGPASDKYRLNVAGYNGTAGDALITGSGDAQYHNNRCFSTSNMDNDASHSRNCARDFHAGFWFGECMSANPNGVYQSRGDVSAGQGLQWRPWKEQYSFKGTEMKFRPRSANPSSREPFRCPVTKY